MHQTLVLIAPLVALGVGLYLVPWRDPAVRRRAAWLLLLPAPAAAMLLLGPIGVVQRPYAPATAALLLKLQPFGVGLAVVVALGLLAGLRGLRRSVLVLGVLCVFGAMAVAGVNELIIDPRS